MAQTLVPLTTIDYAQPALLRPGLKCARCGRPLATIDARLTPTGYACPDCVNRFQARFYTAHAQHYVVLLTAALIAGIPIGILFMALAGGLLLSGILLMPLVGPAVGGATGELLHRLMGKARGRHFWLVAATAMATGAGFVIVVGSIVSLLAGDLVAPLSAAFGLALATTAVATRLRM